MKPKKISQESLSETYQMLIGQLQFEGKLIWTRHQFFIVLNGAILTGLSLSDPQGKSGADILIIYTASISGIILCILWFLTALRSEVYYRYWNSQLRNVESQLETYVPVFQELHIAHLGKPIKIGNEMFRFKSTEKWASISRISRFVAIAFILIWIGLAVFFTIL